MSVMFQAPGKLYLVGEYAVVEAGYPAVIAAIDRYVTVKIETAVVATIWSTQQKNLTVNWERDEEGKICVDKDHPYALLVSALQVTEDYLYQSGVTISESYAVAITSQLDHDESGHKYGLGSSGAVTVAVVGAVLAHYGVILSPLHLYKLAVLSQLELGMTGSFGDIAASSFGGVVAYRSPDRKWLQSVLSEKDVAAILAADWPGLDIKRLSLPAGLELLIGWTGSAASTANLVETVSDCRQTDDKEQVHQQFLATCRTCVESFIRACQTENLKQVYAAVNENRRLLLDFAKGMDLVIETPALTQLCELALAAGAVAKSSGAGGGDCGIAFSTSDNQKEEIYQAWQAAGILPLPFNIAPTYQGD